MSFMPDYTTRLQDGSKLFKMLQPEHAQEKNKHITPILTTHRWLPIKYRIDLKILFTVCKAVNGLAPQYISDLFTTYIPLRTRTSSANLQTVPRINNKSDEGAFSHYGLELWNNLPDDHSIIVSSLKSKRPICSLRPLNN